MTRKYDIGYIDFSNTVFWLPFAIYHDMIVFDVGCIEMHKLYLNTVFCRLDVVTSGLPCLNQSNLHSSGYSWVW